MLEAGYSILCLAAHVVAQVLGRHGGFDAWLGDAVDIGDDCEIADETALVTWLGDVAEVVVEDYIDRAGH